MPNIFNHDDVRQLVARINKLTPASKPLWGKMNAAQRLAHCNVSYELVYDNRHPKPNAFMRFILKTFVKESVVGPKPYKRNQATAPAFRITGDKDFTFEKNRLIDHINKTLHLGENHFHNKESHSFGPLSRQQWNIMFSKHLDHHLQQFGV
jgi:hypothetical protein